MDDSNEMQPAFEKTMYGALLRQKRIEVGYRKAEEFVADLDAIGFKISRAALYRIERGEQEPTASFLIASSILLFGETICPLTSSTRAYRKNGPTRFRLMRSCA